MALHEEITGGPLEYSDTASAEAEAGVDEYEMKVLADAASKIALNRELKSNKATEASVGSTSSRILNRLVGVFL